MTTSPSDSPLQPDNLAAKIVLLADSAIFIELGTIAAGQATPAKLPPHVAEIVRQITVAPPGFAPLESGPQTSRLTIALADELRARELPGVADVIPAYRTILLNLVPGEANPPAIITAIEDALTTASGRAQAPGRLVTLPVAYGGAFGPDLASVAEATGFSPDEVVRRHAREPYLVAFIGFSPGFAYLLGLPKELAVPRLPSPRSVVPAGAVAIGGTQTGVYPLPTPGGWRIIGQTPVRLVDVSQSPPSLLRPGDRLRFEPITETTFHKIAARVARGMYQPPIEPEPVRSESTSSPPASPSRPSSPTSPRSTLAAVKPEASRAGSIVVERAGLLTTVQDLGRPGYGADGITAGGALDRAALVLGNRLLGNDPGAAALEITLGGPTITFTTPTVIAITGADLGALLGGTLIPLWTPTFVKPRTRLSFDPGRAMKTGARAYLCIAGGIPTPLILGSRSTDLTANFGGHEGRPLRDGDRLPVGKPQLPLSRILRRRLTIPPPAWSPSEPIRIMPGPQADWLSVEAWERLLHEPYTVSSQSNRMGIRLIGPELHLPQGADLLSEGIAHGAIQVPGDGQPIVLLAGRQTVGGYPKPATVISADLDRLGQARPGRQLRFQLVTPEQAAAARVELRAVFDPDAVTDTPRVPGSGAARARLLTDLATIASEAGLSSVHMEIRSAQIAVDVKRGPQSTKGSR